MQDIPLAYLITFRTYGTWLHGDPRGAVNPRQNTFGTPLMDPDEEREFAEFKLMGRSPIVLSDPQRRVVDNTLVEVCNYRGWLLHERNVRTNHVHVVVTASCSPETVMNDLKSYSTRRMTEARVFPAGTRPWARHGSTPYLWTPESVEAACRYVRAAQGADLNRFDPEAWIKPRPQT